MFWDNDRTILGLSIDDKVIILGLFWDCPGTMMGMRVNIRSKSKKQKK